MSFMMIHHPMNTLKNYMEHSREGLSNLFETHLNSAKQFVIYYGWGLAVGLLNFVGWLDLGMTPVCQGQEICPQGYSQDNLFIIKKHETNIHIRHQLWFHPNWPLCPKASTTVRPCSVKLEVTVNPYMWPFCKRGLCAPLMSYCTWCWF